MKDHGIGASPETGGFSVLAASLLTEGRAIRRANGLG